jgi:hypothetical protein
MGSMNYKIVFLWGCPRSCFRPTQAKHGTKSIQLFDFIRTALQVTVLCTVPILAGLASHIQSTPEVPAQPRKSLVPECIMYDR